MQNRVELERKAEIMIRNARAALIMTRPFYAVLLGQTTTKASWEFPTMATDSVTHFYNPAFIAGLTPAEVIGLCKHELEHDARHHSTRRGNRDPKKWNIAADYGINGDLIADGDELPKERLYREDLVGFAAEEIYRILGHEEEQKRQQEVDDKAEDDEAGEEAGDEGESEDKESDGDGDEGNGDSDDDADGDEADGKGGKGDDADEGDGDEADDGDGEGEAANANGKGSGDPKSVVGDVGSCGEVLDAPGSEAEKADLDAKWEVTARQAVAMAKKRGDLPGHWANIIEKRKTPTQDWRSILREYINAGARTIQTFNRPNRRLAHTGMVFPGNQRDGINKIVFIVDASGSMSGQHVKIANELQAAMDDGAVSETVIIYCDTRVYRVDRFTADERIEFGPITHGGTDMKPAFDMIEQEESDASLIICLTDLAIGDPGPEPAQPTLFCAYGDVRSIKMWGDTLPAWCKGKILDVDNEVYA